MNPVTSFRRLVWKEARESARVVLVGLACCVLGRLFAQVHFLQSPSQLQEIKDAYTIILSFFFWPVFMLIIGADRFSSDAHSGTLSYLVSLPAPRRGVFWSKLLVSVAGASVLIAAAAALNPYMLEAATRPLGMWDIDVASVFAAFLALLLLFGFAASILVSNPLAAALTGGVALGLYALLFELFYALAAGELVRKLAPGDIRVAFFSPRLFFVSLLVCLVGASWWCFRSMVLSWSGRTKAVRALVAFLLALAIPLGVQLVFNLRVFTTKSVTAVGLSDNSASSRSERIVFAARNRYGRTWLLSIDAPGGAARILPVKAADFYSLSPDGRHLLVQPAGSLLEETLRAAEREDSATLPGWVRSLVVRLAILQGPRPGEHSIVLSAFPTGERAIMLDLENGNTESFGTSSLGRGSSAFEFHTLLWSRTGDRFVMRTSNWQHVPYGKAILGTVGESVQLEAIDLSLPENAVCYFKGFSEQGPELYYAVYQRVKMPFVQGVKPRFEMSFCSINAGNGESKVLYRTEKRFLGHDPSTRYLYQKASWFGQAEPGVPCVEVVNLDTGKTVPVPGEPIDSKFHVLPDNGSAVFVRKAERGSELCLFEPDSNALAVVASAPSIFLLGGSPDGRWHVFLRSNQQRKDFSLCSLDAASREVHVIAPTGFAESLRWRPISWSKGSMFVFETGASEIWSAAPDGTRLLRLYPPEDNGRRRTGREEG